MLSQGPALVVPRDNFCPSGLFELTRRPSGQKISRGTTKPNLRDIINPCTLPRDTKILWFLRYEKKFKVLEAETSEKKFPAAEKKLELMKTAKTKSTKASIFVSSDPFSFSPSQSPESYFCSDFHVFRLAPFFYYRLIFLIFGLILRSTTTHIL